MSCSGNFGCGNGCGGCKMYPEFSYSEASSAAETVVLGVAPQGSYFDGSETVVAAAENGCKCGSNCTCDPCTCK